MSRIEQIGDATLYLGDCREILPMLGKVDAVLTDPPYGIADIWQGGKTSGWGKASAAAPDRNEWDKETLPAALDQALALAERSIVWGGNYYNLPPSRGYLIWDKMQDFTTADSEMAWCSWAQIARTFRYARGQLASEGKEHPAQKPLPLMTWCLGFLPACQLILDPFMGSGTTGVACAKLGRKFLGIELDPKWFDLACRRIQKAYDQPDMFIAPPTKAIQEVFEL